MNYIKITKNDVANGPGVRCVLWVAGCNLHCGGCHNQSTWDFNAGRPFDENAKQELFDILDKPYIQGLTISGGHPLDQHNIEDVLGLVKEVKSKFPTKDIWLYTGYTFEEICEMRCNVQIYNYLTNNKYKYNIWKNLEYVDVLVDGPYIDEQRDITLAFRGSKNQRLINIQESLRQGKIITLQND